MGEGVLRLLILLLLLLSWVDRGRLLLRRILVAIWGIGQVIGL